MIKIQASVSKGWLHKNGGFNFPEKYYLDPVYRRETDLKINEIVRERFPGMAIYNMESNLVQAEFVRDNHVLVGAIQPNMILAAILGARFSFFEDKDSDVVDKPLEHISEASQLPPVNLIPQHSLVKKLDKQIQEIGATHPNLRVIPPFFWDESGRATIHGIITTSLKIVGDNIMVLMMTDPELVHAIHRWIADAYSILVKHFAAGGDLKISALHVGECSGTMISGELYEEFVVPYISQLGENVGSLRLHSCGFSDHLIKPASRIRNLKIFDVGSDTSIKKIRELLGNDIEIHVSPPASLLMDGSPVSNIMKWLDRTLEQNGNGPLQIAYHLEPDYDIRNCLVLHEELENQGLITNDRLY